MKCVCNLEPFYQPNCNLFILSFLETSDRRSSMGIRWSSLLDRLRKKSFTTESEDHDHFDLDAFSTTSSISTGSSTATITSTKSHPARPLFTFRAVAKEIARRKTVF